MQRSHAHPSCVSRSARWASSSQSLSPTSNEYTLAHSVAGALHCHGSHCRDGPTDSLLPGVRCQTRQLGAQGFWFLFFSFLLPSRRAHAACKRRRTPRVCCGDRAHLRAHHEQRPQPRSPTLPPMVRWLGEKASPIGKHLVWEGGLKRVKRNFQQYYHSKIHPAHRLITPRASTLHTSIVHTTSLSRDQAQKLGELG